MKMGIDQDKCTGCRLCEIFCSYHHRKLFNRKISSVEVRRFVDDSSMEIVFHDSKEGQHIPCDNCKGETEPLCTKYCTSGAITYEEGFT